MLEPGDICQYNCADMIVSIVREIERDDPYFKELLDKYREYYASDFFDTFPRQEPPFYVVNYSGDEELAADNDLIKIN